MENQIMLFPAYVSPQTNNELDHFQGKNHNVPCISNKGISHFVGITNQIAFTRKLYPRQIEQC